MPVRGFGTASRAQTLSPLPLRGRSRSQRFTMSGGAQEAGVRHEVKIDASRDYTILGLIIIVLLKESMKEMLS